MPCIYIWYSSFFKYVRFVNISVTGCLCGLLHIKKQFLITIYSLCYPWTLINWLHKFASELIISDSGFKTTLKIYLHAFKIESITRNCRYFGCPIICTDIYSQWNFVHWHLKQCLTQSSSLADRDAIFVGNC